MDCRKLLLSLLLVLPGLVSAAGAAPANPDPWEGFNRVIYRFNDSADRYVLKPVAKGYRAVLPAPVRRGVTNFFSNLREPITVLNDVLQGKVQQAGGDTARFLINSTVGVAGLFDVAVHAQLPHHDEDFGQTLGKWGVKPGPYLVLPFFGPSDVRDTAGLGVDYYSNPRRYYLETDVDWGLWALDGVNSRANLLDAESIIQGDRYLFLRDLYLQHRDYEVKDGKVDDPFLDDSDDGSDGTDAVTPPAAEAAPDAVPAPEPAAAPAPDSAPATTAPEGTPAASPEAPANPADNTNPRVP
jgi:phospholipid-binding lipoprotein MlaA